MLSSDAFTKDLRRKVGMEWDWLHIDVDRDNDVQLVKRPNLCHNENATSASSDKTAYSFHFLDAFLP